MCTLAHTPGCVVSWAQACLGGSRVLHNQRLQLRLTVSHPLGRDGAGLPASPGLCQPLPTPGGWGSSLARLCFPRPPHQALHWALLVHLTLLLVHLRQADDVTLLSGVQPSDLTSLQVTPCAAQGKPPSVLASRGCLRLRSLCCILHSHHSLIPHPGACVSQPPTPHAPPPPPPLRQPSCVLCVYSLILLLFILFSP